MSPITGYVIKVESDLSISKDRLVYGAISQVLKFSLAFYYFVT
jgi:hypothetical protein